MVLAASESSNHRHPHQNIASLRSKTSEERSKGLKTRLLCSMNEPVVPVSGLLVIRESLSQLVLSRLLWLSKKATSVRQHQKSSFRILSKTCSLEWSLRSSSRWRRTRILTAAAPSGRNEWLRWRRKLGSTSKDYLSRSLVGVKHPYSREKFKRMTSHRK